MGSTQQVLTGDALARTKTFAIGTVTNWPAMQLQYVGSALFAEITVEADGDMLFYADDVDGSTTVDPDIGVNSSGDATTDGLIDLGTPHATLNTFRELEGHINAQANWRCFLIGVKPEDSTDDKLDTLSATSCRSDNGLTLFVDEAKSGNLDVGFAVSNQKFSSRPSGGWSTHEAGWETDVLCENMLNFLHVNISNAGAGNIEIYTIDDIGKATTSTLIWDNAYAADTAEEHGATEPAAVFIKAPVGHRLLVWFDITSAAHAAADVHAICTTKHQLGGRVPGANYTGMS